MPTSHIGLIMETCTWPANQKIQYSIMMLYHNIMNSEHKRVARKVLAEQAKSDHENTMISKVEQIAQEIGKRKNKAGNDKQEKSKNNSSWISGRERNTYRNVIVTQ